MAAGLQGNVKPLNMRTAQAAVLGAAQYVQDRKIEISRVTITNQQYAGRWPDEYNSFVSSETRNNQYKDPDKFFRVMHYKPQWYARKFIFRPVNEAVRIKEAVQYALAIIDQKTAEYIAAPNVTGKPSVTTGAYGASFKLMNNYTLLRGLGDLDNIDARAQIQIANVAPYASTIERNALYYAKTIGVIYYAAQMVMKKYPEIGVRFTFPKAATIPGALAKYQTPMLTIGSRAVVIDKLTRPGKNLRRRLRLKRSKR
jgi:hypothetical protein